MSDGDSGKKDKLMIAPLRKMALNGEPYTREPVVEALLVELFTLSCEDLVERALIFKRSDPLYLPSECLLYFLRSARTGSDDSWLEPLYRVLYERVLRSLPRAENLDGRTASITNEAIRDLASGQFVEFLASDRNSYLERLDFFEIHFDGAMANLRKDAQKVVWREANRSKPLEYEDEDGGELTVEVEQAAGSYDPIEKSDLEDSAYRLRLEAAIDTLPTEQRRVIHLLRQDFLIDSKDPGVMTIAKALGRSEKTIRTYRDKAFATLRTAMSNGEMR